MVDNVTVLLYKNLKGTVMAYSGWKLTDVCRADLLQRFTPTHPDLICHHITHIFGSDEVPPVADLHIIGYSCNEGIDCFVVSVDDKCIRPDGKIYHLTFSLDSAKGFKPVMSNDLLMKNTWTHLKDAIYLDVEPFVSN